MNRARRPTRFRGLSIALLLLLIATAAYALGWSSLFTVRQVNIEGVPNKVQTQLIRDRVQVGEKMARLETRAISKSLLKFKWIDHANISRNWVKGTVTIRIWPRTPVATYKSGLMDSSGAMFVLPSISKSHLPLVTATNDSLAKFAVALLMQLPMEIKSAVVGVVVNGPHSASLQIRSTSLSAKKSVAKRIINVIWGGLSDTELKVKVFQALLALPENSKVSTIDVSAPHSPIVK